jgi:hypothetical protein
MIKAAYEQISLLNIIPLLHTDVPVYPEVCGSPDQAVHYHTFGLQLGRLHVWRGTWSQKKEFKLG